MSLSSEVWNKLVAVDVSDHIEKKGKLSYLSWAWAYGIMMENYPDLHYSFEQDRCEFTNTVEISCSVLVNKNDQSMVRSMWLPVMDNRNKAIVNPDKFAINSSKMRCLVKCFAMFGLGHHIYAGEDINPVVAMAAEAVITPDQVLLLNAFFNSTGVTEEQFCKKFKIDAIFDLKAGFYDRAIAMLNDKMASLEAEAKLKDEAK
tara:strand:- start:4558 stop:5166 length:609 start_codon:yes stop_codon:yes gene_type:complete